MPIQTFSNGETLGSIRDKLNSNVAALNTDITLLQGWAAMSSNAVDQILPNVSGAAVLDLYDFSVATGDIVLSGIGENGTRWTTISADPLSSDKTTRVKAKVSHLPPLRWFIEPSISARYRGDYASVYLADTSTPVLTSVADVTIASIQQTTTTLTIILNNPFAGGVGSWISVQGVSDNRLNYFNLCVSGVSRDKKTLTATTYDETTLPSLTVGPYANQGSISLIEPFNFSSNAFGLRTSGTNAGSNAILSRYDASRSYWTSGSVAGSQVTTTGSLSLSPTFTGATGQYSLRATTRTCLNIDPRYARVLDSATDSNYTFTPRYTISNVKPDNAKYYTSVFEVVTPKSMPVPVAKVVSATKSGTTTATIVTDVPHGLTTTNYVQVYGIRDQTNFAKHGAPAVVESVVNATTFTVALGIAATATSYGGSVTLCNGSTLQQGLIGTTVQSVSRSSDGSVTVIGHTNWSSLIVGGLVNLHGVRNSTDGSDVGVDGVYRVNTISTTTLILEPIYDYLGVLKSPYGSDGSAPVLNSTNCGGCVIDRVEARTHDLGLERYSDVVVSIDGQGTADLTRSLPVILAASPTVTANAGTAIGASSTGYSLLTAATTNATSLKTTSGNLYEFTAYNFTASPVFVKFYNKASAPTVGTDTPVYVIPVPASGHTTLEFGATGKRFNTALAFAVTANAAITDSTAVTAGSCLLSLTYI